jgi:molybdate transport system substrate-binding protein
MITAVAALFLAAAPVTSREADISVLSAGAVEPGLRAFAQLVTREMGHNLTIQVNTAPQIVERLTRGEVYDILISPAPVLDQAAKDGKVATDTRVPVGRVGAGIVVRADAPIPDVGSVEALENALRSADSVVYNTASTGLYLDWLFARLGILDDVKPKSTRYADGASVMKHVSSGRGNEIGFGAITEIRMHESAGLRYVGPLPADAQNYTSYEAAMMMGATAQDSARAVLRLLATPAGRAALRSGGVE